MGRYLLYFIGGITVSLYYFSFSFTFLPAAFNTKMGLAFIGVGMMGYRLIRRGRVQLDRIVLEAVGFAAVFSLIGFIAVDYNGTWDYSYATYLISFFTWFFAAYTVCVLLQRIHRQLNIRILTYYLAAVCVVQGILALVIDNNLAFQLWVNTYVLQGQTFLMDVNRLYGIGASLDNAGVRFSVVLILLASVMTKDWVTRPHTLRLAGSLLAFFFIIVVGNMMSRTTIIGAGLGAAILLWNNGITRKVIDLEDLRFLYVFLGILLLGIGITVYFYNTDPLMESNIRFAFEGFFNWVEEGEWRTDSTDKLNNNMWIWPEDIKTWIIGTGLFDDWVFNTDIGYCRHILYSGVTGFSVFAGFFVFLAVTFGRIFRTYRDMFVALGVLTFLIWIKVSTDIFIIYALFFGVYLLQKEHLKDQEREDHLLHSGDL